MNAPKPRQEVLNYEFINEVREKAFENLMYHINYENFLYTHNWLSNKTDFQRKTNFKAYICRGNNGSIVKTVLKKRWWWTLVTKCDPEDCDFIWTQWLKPKVIKGIENITDNTNDTEHNHTYDLRENTDNNFKQT